MQCDDFFLNHLNTAIQTSLQQRDELKVFLHIPKTAGSSVQRDLQCEFPDNHHIPTHQLEERWDQFIALANYQDIHHVRGHITHQHLLKLDQKRIPFQVISYLRHPLHRLKSHFNWVHTSIDPKFLKSTPSSSFREFAQGRMENYLTNRLVGPCESAEEALQKIKRRYWFVGLAEYYHLCQGVLMKAMGRNYRIRPPKNQTTQKMPSVQLELDRELLEELQDGMKIDFAVFEYFRSAWEKKINEACELLF